MKYRLFVAVDLDISRLRARDLLPLKNTISYLSSLTLRQDIASEPAWQADALAYRIRPRQKLIVPMRDQTKAVLVILVLILTVSGSIAAINGKEEVAAQYRLHTSSSFRYAIVRSEVSKALPVRQVWVLMEERAFTEENLKSLYQFVVKRFPEPYQMDIWVYTSLQDVPTPEEADSDEGMSEVKEAPPLRGAPTAVCVRNEKTEYINYFFPSPKGQEHGKIIIRGPEKQK